MMLCKCSLPTSFKRIGSKATVKTEISVFRDSRAANPVVGSQIRSKLELIQAFKNWIKPQRERGDTVWGIVYDIQG